MATTPRLPARYYAQLAPLLEAQGIAPERLLRAARLAPSAFVASANLSLAQAERLGRAALRLSGDADLGQRLGAAIAPGQHAVLGQALLRCPTLDAALRLAARYFALLSPGFRLRYTPAAEMRGLAEVWVQPRMAFSPGVLRLHLQAVLGGLINELRFLLGGALPTVRVSVSWARGGPRRAATEPGIAYGAEALPGFRLGLPMTAVLAPRPPVDAAQLADAVHRCEQLLQRHRARGRLSDWVAMMLSEAQHGLPSQAELADLLAIAPRSLARALAAEGQSFRRLRDAAVAERARLALSDPRQSVTDLALQLGYRDAGNFSRAVRRSCGQSPRRLRQPNL